MSRIPTSISHGTGDARVALILCPARECIPGAKERDLVAALDTNGGAFALNITERNDELTESMRQLGCDFPGLKAAILAAYPAAAKWDWMDGGFSHATIDAARDWLNNGPRADEYAAADEARAAEMLAEACAEIEQAEAGERARVARQERP